MDAGEFKWLFGRRLRSLRQAAARTQEQLAEAANCSTEYISRVERGLVSPSFEMIVRLADALGVRPQALFDFDAAPDDKPGEKGETR
jgi:transcriptional regulator with XRE-family HTH domain